MIRSGVVVIAVLAFAIASASAAPTLTVSQLQVQTKQVFNRRAAFTNAPFTITSVRCQRDTATAFFCIGKTAWVDGGQAPAPVLMWNVMVDTHGIIHWRRA